MSEWLTIYCLTTIIKKKLTYKTEMMHFGSRLRPVEDVVAEAMDPENSQQRDHYLVYLLVHAYDTQDIALRRVCDRIKMAHGDKPFTGIPASAHNIPNRTSTVSVSEYAQTYTVEERVKRAMEIIIAEGIIKNAYDHAFVFMLMNQNREMPNFISAQSYLDYMKGLGFVNFPSKDTIEKKVSGTIGNYPSWSFIDGKGQDAAEARRRNNVATRFFSAFRKGV